MAHELEIIDGVAQMVYVGDVPWHGLGTKIPADLSPQQVLEKAGLDWTVQKHPAFANVGGKQVSVGWSALTRSSDDKILSVVTNEWMPLQNHEAFNFFDEYCRAGDMEMHTAGSLKGGQIVWALAKVKESFELFKGDRVDSYMLLTNPHKFGQSIDVRFTPIRVVCNNTLTLSLNTDSDRQVKKSHRTEFNAAQVKEQLGIATDKLVKYKEMAAFLGSKRFTEDSLKEYFGKVFPILVYNKEKGPQRKNLSKSATRALEIIDTQPGAEYARGSWWSAFNAVTYLTDHEIGKSVDTRLTSAWFGPNKNLKVKALETAVEFAEAA
jgi:phage/plasmid-like protein (TIGR03299 family)